MDAFSDLDQPGGVGSRQKPPAPPGQWPAVPRGRSLLVIAPTLLGLLAGAGCDGRPGDEAVGPSPADLLLRDARVYTMDAARSWADAVAVADGRVAWVGAAAEADERVGPDTEVLDLDGRMVLPGFHDTHVHAVSGGLELGECRLHALTTPETILERVRECAAETAGNQEADAGGETGGPDPPDAAGGSDAGAEADETRWIRGGGWQLPVFPGANPRKEPLDGIVPDRPVYLTAADGHSAWVNSRALEIARIDADTPDPPGGRIERDPETGEPSGTLREAATRLVSRHIPRYTREDRVEGLRRAVKLANRRGITTWQEANGSPADLYAYARLDELRELTVRTAVAMGFEPAELDSELARLREQRDRHRGSRLQAGAVKIFADGVIESHTAALLEPYTGLDHRGEAYLTPGLFAEVATALDAAGFQIHTHAIGDRAIRMALDAYAAARRANGPRDARHQVAHVQLFDPADIPRFRELGAVAVFQPLWAYADTYITELTIPVLGPERSRWIYPIRSVAGSGAPLACGSDWTVSSMDPLEGIQVGMTRARPGDPDDEAWIPEERVDLDTMLSCYTIGAAWSLFREDETGSIEPGKAADLVVLDGNLFGMPPRQIRGVRVVLTLLGGEVVYRDAASAVSSA